MKRTYICTIDNNSFACAREYAVATSSALKAAQLLGFCGGGEVVRIYTKSGKQISEARWTPEDGGKYYRCLFWQEGASA